MIIDRTENLKKYKAVLPGLGAALAAINHLAGEKGGNYAALETGRREFEGGYFMVQEGTTRPAKEASYEFHKKYIDVQIILSGSEYVGWETASRLKETVPYDETKDIGFAGGEMDHVINITAGMFYAAFPQDMHAPCLYLQQPNEFKKIVIKLPAV